MKGSDRRAWHWGKVGFYIDKLDKRSEDLDHRWSIIAVSQVGQENVLTVPGCPSIDTVRAFLQLMGMLPAPALAPVSDAVQELLDLIDLWRERRFAIPVKVLEAVDRVRGQVAYS
jgi:hypothetical protein